MVLRRPHIDLRVPGVAVGPVGIGSLPVIMSKVRLRESHEHANVVRGLENFREADMGSWLAAIVVRVHKIDAETLQALQGFARALVGCRPGAELGIIQRHGRKVDARAVQVEILAVDPKLAKAETHGMANIQ